MTNSLSGFSVPNDANFPTSPGASDADQAQPGPAVTTTDGQAAPTQPAMDIPIVGGMAKEQIEMGPSVEIHDRVPLVEIKEEEAIPEEVSSWIEKLEKGEDIQLPQPVMHDDQVLVQSPTAQISDDMIILPMTEEEVRKGLHEHLYTGARWLAEWCVRIMKKFHGHVMYRANQAGGTNGSN